MWRKYLDAQYRKPSGPVGRWVGRTMARQHAPENRWTVELLEIMGTDHVLEIGFGPGLAIELVSRSAEFVAGIDFSRTMLATARRRNAAGIRRGSIDLRLANAEELPFGNDSFDKAYSIHSIYFWPDPMRVLREVKRVLKPGGLLILTVLPKDRWPKAESGEAGTAQSVPYSGSELVELLETTGFEGVALKSDQRTQNASNFSVRGHEPNQSDSET